MLQLGGLLLILGFGTFVLDLFDYEFRILSWATDYQPWLSLGLGIAGLIIVGLTFFLGKNDEPAAAESTSSASQE